jgi:hypothetical protein
MLAEGLPAESYLDTGNRDMFENDTGVTVLYPDFRTSNDAKTCVPLHRSGPAVHRAHDMLLTLAHALQGSPELLRANG